jgi:hypothetical protein
MPNSLTIHAFMTKTISTGTFSYSPVTVGIAGTLDVTGAGTDVTLNNITTSFDATYEVTDGATLDVQSFASHGAGDTTGNSYDIGNNATLELGSSFRIDTLGRIDFDNTAGTQALLELDSHFDVDRLGPIDGWKNGSAIELNGVTINCVSWSQSDHGGGTLTVRTNHGTEQLDFGTGHYTDANFNHSGDVIGWACFAAGTCIDGPDGPVAVENLAAGDLVCVASGAVRPVKWIGFRRLDLARYDDPKIAHPILIEPDAIADDWPRRELLVSPDHAIAIGGKLIPARMLVNGATIRCQTERQSVTYYHVELDTHDVLLAEGLPVESYLDTGNRSMFENADGPITMRPDFADLDPSARRAAGCCLPFTVDAACVKPVWFSLASRAQALGYTLPPDPESTDDPGLCLLADGRRLRPISNDGGRTVFVLPAPARSLRLLSRSTVPSDDMPWLDDRRRIGVMVRGITLRAGQDHRAVAMDDPNLLDGWWAAEHVNGGVVRWTDGDAAIGSSPGRGTLTVELAGTASAYPIDPPVADDEWSAPDFLAGGISWTGPVPSQAVPA